MTTLNRIKTYIPRKHKDLHGKLDTLYRNLQEVKTRIHKAFADIASQLSEKIGKMLDEAKGDAVEAQSKTAVKKQQKAKGPEENVPPSGKTKFNTVDDIDKKFSKLDGLVGNLPPRRELTLKAPYPSGIDSSNKAFGELIGWNRYRDKFNQIGGTFGNNSEAFSALKRADSISPDDIANFKNAGLTPEITEGWRGIYVAQARNLNSKDKAINTRRATPEARAILMQDIADSLR